MEIEASLSEEIKMLPPLPEIDVQFSKDTESNNEVPISFEELKYNAPPLNLDEQDENAVLILLRGLMNKLLMFPLAALT